MLEGGSVSLGRITLYAMALGVVVGVLAQAVGAALGRDLPAAGIGMATALISTIIAGRVQPIPRKRR